MPNQTYNPPFTLPFTLSYDPTTAQPDSSYLLPNIQAIGSSLQAAPGAWWDAYQRALGQPAANFLRPAMQPVAQTVQDLRARARNEPQTEWPKTGRRTVQDESVLPGNVGPLADAQVAAVNEEAGGGGNAQDAPVNPMAAWLAMLQGPTAARPGVSGYAMPARPQLETVSAEYPRGPVPQMEAPAAYDPTLIRQYMELAKPIAPETSDKDLWLAGILGALGGFDSRPGDNLGMVLGRMVAAGAPAYMAEKKDQKALKRQQEADMRAYYANMAGTEATIENNRLARDDARRQTDFSNRQSAREDEFKKLDYNMQIAQLNNNIKQGDFQNAMAQLQYLKSAGIADRQLDLAERQLGVSMWSAMLRSQTAGKGMLKSLSPIGQLSELASQIVNKKLAAPPFIDLPGLTQQARDEIMANPATKTLMMTNPEAFRAEVDRRLMQTIMAQLAINPNGMKWASGFANNPLGGGGSSAWLNALNGTE